VIVRAKLLLICYTWLEVWQLVEFGYFRQAQLTVLQHQVETFLHSVATLRLQVAGPLGLVPHTLGRFVLTWDRVKGSVSLRCIHCQPLTSTKLSNRSPVTETSLAADCHAPDLTFGV
jgi:hypothetical protein